MMPHTDRSESPNLFVCLSKYSVMKTNTILSSSLLFLIWTTLIYAKQESGYFNQTSLITIQDHIWESNDMKEITFRTCSASGNLLSLTGKLMPLLPWSSPVSSSDSHELLLRIQNSRVKFSWKINGLEGSMQVGQNVSTNKWYTVSLKQKLRSLELSLFRIYDLVGESVVVANWTFNSYLLRVRLYGSMKIGQGFSGCLYQGPGAIFTSAGYTATDVSWDVCPLARQHGCTKEEQDPDDCYTMPCLNKGPCIDGINSYTCVCPLNINGTHCENNLPEMYGCRMQPCMNHAVCLQSLEVSRILITCICHAGYSGRYCEIVSDLCSSSPCQQGTCSHDNYNYRCDCTDSGFTGPTCSEDINECLNKTTCRGFPCSNRPGGFTCLCPPGYEGPYCQEINECTSSPCMNGGTCTDGINKFSCECRPGYTGEECEVDIDDCTNSPCQHGGACHDGVNAFTCSCAPGYTGPVCEVDIDACVASSCTFLNKNCLGKINGYLCLCKEGFTGDNCSVKIDDCPIGFCANGGECVQDTNGYHCKCPSEYMGKNCTEPYDACALRPCLNGADCTTSPPQHSYNCTCVHGFQGSNCEVNIDDCVGHNCSDFQVCYDGVGNYSCGCSKGYTGTRCESKNVTCDTEPCQNNGTCEPDGDSYKCHCVNRYINITSNMGYKAVFLTGYNGTNCEQDINECDYSDPPICQQGGICVDSPPGRFSCYCKNYPHHLTFGETCEYKGDYCDVRHAGQECHNGGTCVNLNVGFRCQCAPGFQGRYCQDEIDECRSHPCQNNGTCSDKINGYVCTCENGFSGTNCETNIDV